jgi:hypothetical protein
VIVSRRGGDLVLVRQVDHQDQCGLMADAWGNGGFALPAPAGPLALAARVHDEGWRTWEEAPQVGEDGAPVDFTEIDRPTHVALYRDGIETAIAADPRAGLLVSMHGQGLYEGRRGLDPGPPTPRADRPPQVRAFIEEQDGVQERLRERIGPGPELDAWASASYRLLQAWDVLSLYLTWRALPEGREGTLPQVPRAVGDPGVELRLSPAGEWSCACAPWPFRGDAVELPVAARRIPDRPYRSAAELAEALARAQWLTLPFTVRPG